MKHFLSTLLLFIISITLGNYNLYSQTDVKIDYNTFGAIEARQIGPAVMSGRISAIDAWEKDPRVVYIGTAGGGVWKSINGGITAEPVFDDYVQSIGAIALDQSHPDTVWAGTGEPWTRNSVSIGKGLYKTTNGGESWELSGLENTERIGRIEINPENPDIVYVAALGHLWNSNEERGVYKTSDGGKTWKKILYVNENTGCSDLSLDPENPEIIYAAMWNHRRLPYTFRSGGKKGSALYKSADGGETWKKLTNGLPQDSVGRIAVDVSPASPNIVYAVVEAKNKGGLYKSYDNGTTWDLVNETPAMKERPFYFSYIVADPVDTNIVYKPGFQMYISRDGGETFESGSNIFGGGVHADLHALWISKKNNNNLYLGTDGGVYVSNDQAGTWRILRNLPVSTFYHVSADNQYPYNVYGGLQDNGSWMGPSASPGGIENSDWSNVGGGDGFYVFPDPYDPNIIYWQSQGGNINRFFKDSRESKSIKPYADEETQELRFNWNTPVVFGKHSKALYVGAQYLYKSNDKGDTWKKISPDLSTNDPEKQKQDESGGITIDNTTAENHTTIYAIHESPLDSNIIWVGTDDGNLQVTKNEGKKWKNVVSNVPGLPIHTWCSYVKASKHDKKTAYVTFDGHRTGDMNTYVYKTTDLGETWKPLQDENIEGYSHVIEEDTKNPNLLFLGTEFGLYVTIDGGQSWARFKGNIPKVSVRDIYFQEREQDLILATHGRGILIIDDITPVRHLNEEVLNSEMAYLESKPSIIKYLGYQQKFNGDDEFVGPNESQATMLTYYLKKRHIFGDMHLEIYNEEGEMTHELPAGKRKGINRVELNLRKKPPKVPQSKSLAFGAMFGPSIEAGEYTVKIMKNEQVEEGKFTIKYDPNSRHTIKERKVRHKKVMQAYNLLEELAFVVAQINKLRDDCTEKLSSVEEKEIKEDLNALKTELTKINIELVSTESKGIFGGDEKIREKLATLYGSITNYQGKPTQSQIDRLNYFNKQIEEHTTRFNQLAEERLNKINKELKEAGEQPIQLLTKKEFDSQDNQ